MAFNMKRPIIQGTVLHKTSIALAKKKSIVTPASVGADQTLVNAGEWMGKSNVGEPIDFSIDQDQVDYSKIKFGRRKGKKKKGKSDEIVVEGANEQAHWQPGGGFGEDNSDIKAPEVDYKKPKSDIRVMTPKELKKANRKKKNGKKKDTWYRDSNDDGNWFSKDRKGGDAIRAIGGGLFFVGDKIVDGANNILEGTVTAAGEIINKTGQLIGNVKDGIEEGLRQIDDTVSDITKQLNAALANAKTTAEKNKIQKKLDAQLIIDNKQKLKDQKEIDTALTLERKNEEELKTRLIDEQAQFESAKKHKVEIDELELKTVNGVEGYYPKQDIVGGRTETKWDDNLGRFYVPNPGGLSEDDIAKLTPRELKEYNAAVLVFNEESKAETERMKVKYAEGFDPNDATNHYLESGQVAYDMETNTYSYTPEYYRIQNLLAEETKKREAKEKRNVWQGPKEKNDDGSGDANNNNIPDYLEVDNSTESVMQQRNDRIWGYAKQGGPLQQNMRKSGYIPQKER